MASPGHNREINEKGLFRFDQSKELRGWQKRFREVLAPVIGRNRYETFMKVAEAYDPNQRGIPADDLIRISQATPDVPLEEIELFARGVQELLDALNLKQ